MTETLNPLGLSEKSIESSILRALRTLDAKASNHMRSWPVGMIALGETVRIEIKAQRSRGYTRGLTGKWQVTVGSWRDKKIFMAFKNDFDYAAIAALIVERARGEKASRINTARLKREARAFVKTDEYKILNALGVDLEWGDHHGVEMLRKLSPAALAELKKACGVK